MQGTTIQNIQNFCTVLNLYNITGYITVKDRVRRISIWKLRNVAT